MDEKVFGPDVDVFRIERFLEKPSLAKDSSFRPFGGGLNYCPGRFLAKKEVLTVVGLLFSKHDICLQESGQAFPQMATKKPGLGIAGPAANQNVLVRVRKVQEGS
jgi:cytochrome P450